MKNALYTTFNDAFLETGATMIYSFLDNNKINIILLVLQYILNLELLKRF